MRSRYVAGAALVSLLAGAGAASAQTAQPEAGFAHIGYKVSPHVRIELEGGSRPGDGSTVLRYRIVTDFRAAPAPEPPSKSRQ